MPKIHNNNNSTNRKLLMQKQNEKMKNSCMIPMKTFDIPTSSSINIDNDDKQFKSNNDNNKITNINRKKHRPYRLSNLNKTNNQMDDNNNTFLIELIEVSITTNKQQSSDNILFESLNFRIDNGQIFAIIGSKQTGKTSLLETIATIRLPTSGNVTYYGQHYDQPIRIGFMPQTDGFFSQLTIIENLLLMTRLHGLPMEEVNIRYDRLINLIGISEAKQPIKQLDQSKQSLISLSLASIHSPSVLILDEPDFGSDLILKEQIWRQLNVSSKQERITVIFSTKNVEDCRFADQAAIIDHRQLYPCHLYQINISDPIACSSNDDDQKNDTKTTIKEKFSTISLDANEKINEFTRHCLSARINSEIIIAETLNELKKTNDLEPCEPNRYRQVSASTKFITIFQLLIKLFILKKLPLTLLQLILPTLSVIFCLKLLGQNPHELMVAVYNPDSPPIVSKHVLNVLDSQTIDLIHYDNLDDAIQMVRNGQAWAALEFPANYTNSIFNQALEHCDDVSGDDDEINLIINPINGSTTTTTILPEQEFETKINMVTILMYVDNTNILIAGFVKARVLQALERAHHDAKENQVETRMTQPLSVVVPNVYGDENTPMTDFLLPGVIMLAMQFSISILSIWELNELIHSKMFHSSLAMARISRCSLLIIWFCIKFLQIIIQTILFIIILLSIMELRFQISGLTLFITLSIIQSIIILMATIILMLSTSLQTTIIIHWINFIIQITLAGLIFPLQCLPPIIHTIMLYLYPSTSIAESMRSAMSRGWSFDHYFEHTLVAEFVWLSINISSIWIMVLLLLFIIILNKSRHY
ncbi:ABC transporter G family member 23-like isoform X2 [Dermatophagoides pteronyssinus]|uniref:ABC transporter G family member 23-like isoform X2 n=1 Tax=Dermatophagoides pteronyssinus TaxID=6956 RepID=UPI003F6687E4